MARAIWSGSISFGLVNIPVKLYVAVREQRVQFHMLHDQDKARLRRKLVSSTTGKEVHPEHIVKGYEVGPDEYVVVQQNELEALQPEKSRTIDIVDFVDQKEIDPVFYDRAYYLAPDQNASKPYRLLVEAMQKSRKVAVAKFVMREKEYLAALRPVDGVICLSTMHFGDEVLDPQEVTEVPEVKVDDREVKMAEQLIGTLTSRFDPNKYKDEYRERVMEMVQRKAKGEKVVVQSAPAEKPGRVINLMAALEASLAEAKKSASGGSKKRSAHPGQNERRRKSA
jgi:DNA end-binding protein Ku